MNNSFIIICPHCNDNILIYEKEINCKIFRHGVYKHNNKQINPHASKVLCDELIKYNLIYGCGKPFSLVKVNDNYIAHVCDYK